MLFFEVEVENIEIGCIRFNKGIENNNDVIKNMPKTDFIYVKTTEQELNIKNKQYSIFDQRNINVNIKPIIKKLDLVYKKGQVPNPNRLKENNHGKFFVVNMNCLKTDFSKKDMDRLKAYLDPQIKELYNSVAYYNYPRLQSELIKDNNERHLLLLEKIEKIKIKALKTKEKLEKLKVKYINLSQKSRKLLHKNEKLMKNDQYIIDLYKIKNINLFRNESWLEKFYLQYDNKLK